jgi:hypothetical protein
MNNAFIIGVPIQVKIQLLGVKSQFHPKNVCSHVLLNFDNRFNLINSWWSNPQLLYPYYFGLIFLLLWWQVLVIIEGVDILHYEDFNDTLRSHVATLLHQEWLGKGVVPHHSWKYITFQLLENLNPSPIKTIKSKGYIKQLDLHWVQELTKKHLQALIKIYQNLCSVIDNDTPNLGFNSNSCMNINNEWKYPNVQLCIHESKGEFKIIEKFIIKTNLNCSSCHHNLHKELKIMNGRLFKKWTFWG